MMLPNGLPREIVEIIIPAVYAKDSQLEMEFLMHSIFPVNEEAFVLEEKNQQHFVQCYVK
ncbi:MAG: hypothetical protein ACLTRS_02620 [Lachnospiraceae bacterium]